MSPNNIRGTVVFITLVVAGIFAVSQVLWLLMVMTFN